MAWPSAPPSGWWIPFWVIAGLGVGAAGLLALAGKTIRARGWIEIGNGPKIEIAHPSQIEIVARE